MESIELRQYFTVIRKWLWLIVLGTLLCGGTAAIVSFTMAPVYEAEAGVIIVKSGYEVTFEPKFRTLSEADLARYGMDLASRRKALTALVESGEVASEVLAGLGSILDPEEQEVAALLKMVKAETEGDMIKIKVRAKDPKKAAAIANAWGEAYEKYVNGVYSGMPQSLSDIQAQAAAAKRDYEEAEAALIEFMADNRIDELNRQISEKQQIISSLQSGKQTAITTVINKELQARSQIISEYINTQVNNRLIAFRKEQEAKSTLLSSYMDAETTARNAVFNKQVEAKLQTLSDYYTAKNKIERLLADAKSLREQIQAGSSSPSSATANSLAIILLQTSAFTSWANLPVDLQVPMEQLADLDASPQEQLRDLDTLISVLEAKREELQADINEQSRQLLNNEGYEFLLATPSGDNPLSQAIKEKYPELFEMGDLTKLAESVASDNPLVVAASEKSRALLQLEGLEDVVAYSRIGEPMTVAIDDLQDEINRLQGELEQENARKQELTAARDLAWETYNTLARKLAEVEIASQAMGTEVRFAVPAIEPEFPVAPRKRLNTLLASVVGCMLAVGVAFLIEYLDDTIRTTDAVQALGLSTLGTLPRFRFAEGDEGPIAAVRPRSPLAEAYRILRTKIQVATDRPLDTLLVTSANPFEGKSTVVANLGVVMAQAGLSVIVVDSDLRCPILHDIFGLPNKVGLSNALIADGPSHDGYLQTTQLQNLRVLTSGPLPPNPAELLGSRRMGRVIQQLKEEADVVLFDSPAVLAVADAALLAKQMDGVLLVVEAGATRREAALRAKEDLTRVGANLIGAVLNKLSPKGAGGYYYHYYSEEGEKRRRRHKREPARDIAGAIKRWVTRLPLLRHSD